MKTHSLKTWPQFFRSVRDRLKNFELRKHDRDFKVGDYLLLHEWDPKTERYTGQAEGRSIKYVLSGPAFGLMEGWCILGLDDKPFTVGRNAKDQPRPAAASAQPRAPEK